MDAKTILQQAARRGLPLSHTGTAFLFGRGKDKHHIAPHEAEDLVLGRESEGQIDARLTEYGSDTFLGSHAQLQARAARVGSEDGWSAADEDAAWALMQDRQSEGAGGYDF